MFNPSPQMMFNPSTMFNPSFLLCTRAPLQKPCLSASCSFHSYGSSTSSETSSWSAGVFPSVAKYHLFSRGGLLCGSASRYLPWGALRLVLPWPLPVGSAAKGCGTLGSSRAAVQARACRSGCWCHQPQELPVPPGCASCRGPHQLWKLRPSKVPPPPPADDGAASPPNTASHRFHRPHTLWMSQKQPPTHTTLGFFVFVAPNLLPHVALFPYDTEFFVRTKNSFSILGFSN